MDLYQQFIHQSRYARFDYTQGRRETWPETVGRYFDFFQGHLLDKHGYRVPTDQRRELETAVLDLEVMPSMRALMTAGEALRRTNVAGYNCFHGQERFMTREGLRTFAETVGTTQTVLAGDGEWREAEIRSFGVQKLNRVHLRPGHRSRTKFRRRILVTADHRWHTVARGEVTDLRVGDRIPFVGAPEEFDLDAFIHGIGYGDGTLDDRGRARIRLCGAKAKLLPYFEQYGHCSVMYPPSSGNDPIIVFHKGHFEDWKTLPEVPSHSFFAGYLEADGHKNEVQPGISTQDVAAQYFILDNSAYAGLAVTGLNFLEGDTNYGPRSGALARIGLRPEIVFVVDQIDKDIHAEEVFCAVEPVTRSFVLEGGVLTGNCAYLAVDSLRAFDEAMYVLLCGTGVGYSVRRKHVAKLPEVRRTLRAQGDLIVVEDSKEGWAQAFREVLDTLFHGMIPVWDVSKVRPAGAPLKTFGGRASGPGPLEDLFRFATSLVNGAQGRQLTPLECHDLMCKIGDVVVVGGVRRSAMISISDIDDEDMRLAKSGEWWRDRGHRRLANNTAFHEARPGLGTFLREWAALYDSKSGERGIFNHAAALAQLPVRRDPDHEFGLNPCGEILLRSNEFCNLSEVVARPGDTRRDLLRKVGMATTLGTWQSTLTDFPYLSEGWRLNTAEERLLGVSLTGIVDNETTRLADCGDLEMLRWCATLENKAEAETLGIPASAAVTCVKPSGTVSQLCNSGSGINEWHSPHFIRNVRNDVKDPVSQLMRDAGVPCEPDRADPTGNTLVFSFPRRAPEGAVVRDDWAATEKLNLWLRYKRHFCEHNPSTTVNVREDEWMGVGDWVWRHFDEVVGIAFLPFSDHVYEQAPYQDCTETEYREAVARMPERIEWSDLRYYEEGDQTKGSQTLACVGGTCELV